MCVCKCKGRKQMNQALQDSLRQLVQTFPTDVQTSVWAHPLLAYSVSTLPIGGDRSTCARCSCPAPSPRARAPLHRGAHPRRPTALQQVRRGRRRRCKPNKSGGARVCRSQCVGLRERVDRTSGVAPRTGSLSPVTPAYM